MVMPLINGKDPDATVVALFRNHAVRNEKRSIEAKRPQFDDMEVVELRYPGSRNVGVYPATSVSHWENDVETGEQRQVTYAERFSRQYRQFKAHQAQTKSGTPLDFAQFLTEARRAELRAQNIYTVEALAEIDGQELKNLGPGGRDMKNRAIEYLMTSDSSGVNAAVQAQLDALKAQNAILREDLARIKRDETVDDPDAKGGDSLETMSIEQLRDFITNLTGHPPIGAVNRKTLVKMAERAQKATGKDEAA